MTELWKLTTQEWETRNDTKWGPGVTHETSGEGELCGPGWLHAYTSPLLAVLLNPIHADIKNPVLWRCEGDIWKSDDGLKVGTMKLTTIEIVPLPVVTKEQRVKFGILCALKVYREPGFVGWAERWLSGEDRSETAARAAEAEAEAAEEAEAAAEAARAAAEGAAWAWAAEGAAGAAAEAARAVAEGAAWAAEGAAWAAAEAAEEAAEGAAWAAAEAAEEAAAGINLQELAEEAVR